MTPLVPALGGALMVAGLIGAGIGVRRTPETPDRLRRTRPVLAGRFQRISRRTRLLLLVGVGGGVVVALLTGWVIAVILGPAVVAGLPVLLSAPPAAARIGRLEAMEEWIRSLSGVLSVGVGLEQALMATVRSTSDEASRLLCRSHVGCSCGLRAA
jgi:tight adherence protein B